MKTANQILKEHGINTIELNDDFNTQLFHAMERYAEEYATNLKQCKCKSNSFKYVGKLLQCDECGVVFKS